MKAALDPQMNHKTPGAYQNLRVKFNLNGEVLHPRVPMKKHREGDTGGKASSLSAFPFPFMR